MCFEQVTPLCLQPFDHLGFSFYINGFLFLSFFLHSTLYLYGLDLSDTTFPKWTLNSAFIVSDRKKKL